MPSKRGNGKHPLIGYNPNKKRLFRASIEAHSERQKDKVKNLVGKTAGAETKYQADASRHWKKLYDQGHATRRKRDGSYFIIGDPPVEE